MVYGALDETVEPPGLATADFYRHFTSADKDTIVNKTSLIEPNIGQSIGDQDQLRLALCGAVDRQFTGSCQAAAGLCYRSLP